MPADDDFDDRCRRLYRSLRDGSVDREAAFDLSADILAYRADGKAANVAELAIDEDAAPALLATAVRALLPASRLNSTIRFWRSCAVVGAPAMMSTRLPGSTQSTGDGDLAHTAQDRNAVRVSAVADIDVRQIEISGRTGNVRL